jgi:hypothetical protein
MMPTELESLVETVQRRQLTTPLLLLLASHHPLAFVTGQALYALMPLGLLLGWESIGDWAALLSAPDASKHLTAILTTSPAGFPTPAEQTAK